MSDLSQSIMDTLGDDSIDQVQALIEILCGTPSERSHLSQELQIAVDQFYERDSNGDEPEDDEP